MKTKMQPRAPITTPAAIKAHARQLLDTHELLDALAFIASMDRRRVANRDRLAAIKLLLEYAYGRPQESVEVTGKEGGPIRIETTKAHLVALLSKRLEVEKGSE